MIIRSTLLAASMLLAAGSFAMAQNSVTGDGKMSTTTTPSSPSASASQRNENQPGATGMSKVPGNTSTMAGDSTATAQQRTGTTSPSGGGGGR